MVAKKRAVPESSVSGVIKLLKATTELQATLLGLLENLPPECRSQKLAIPRRKMELSLSIGVGSGCKEPCGRGRL
jgi:hypothetical protein